MVNKLEILARHTNKSLHYNDCFAKSFTYISFKFTNFNQKSDSRKKSDLHAYSLKLAA